MSMLMFLPWCPIEERHELGPIAILPFRRHETIEELPEAAQCHVNGILAMYKNTEGRPVARAGLVSYREKSPISGLTDDEIDVAQEFVALACFSGLAHREYFNTLGAYCNSDSFRFTIQKFDKADFTTLVTRRREGRTLNALPMDEVAITIPVHCGSIQTVSLDRELLQALVVRRTDADADDWARWQNAIASFNQANTDSDTVSHQVEWVHLCGAFEHLLGAKPNAKDVAQRFSDAMEPAEDLPASSATRRSDRWQRVDRPLRYEWMREFYRIRGDFAHGTPDTRQPVVWKPLEHLVLASTAFPLLVRTLLANEGTYTPTHEDQAQIDCFEKFADTPDCLKPPDDQRGSIDSHWGRLVSDRASSIGIRRAFDEAWEDLTPEQQESLEGNSQAEGL